MKTILVFILLIPFLTTINALPPSYTDKSTLEIITLPIQSEVKDNQNISYRKFKKSHKNRKYNNNRKSKVESINFLNTTYVTDISILIRNCFNITNKPKINPIKIQNYIETQNQKNRSNNDQDKIIIENANNNKDSQDIDVSDIKESQYKENQDIDASDIKKSQDMNVSDIKGSQDMNVSDIKG
ncbi:hypothetical protein BB561_004816, partial [Smittium simulii]